MTAWNGEERLWLRYVELGLSVGGKEVVSVRMAMDAEKVCVIEANEAQAEWLKRIAKYDRKNRWWWLPASLESLDALRKMTPLPAPIEERRRELGRIRDAVDRERARPDRDIRPLREPPVKRKLYAHQTRALNMALLVFGAAAPEEAAYDA